MIKFLKLLLFPIFLFLLFNCRPAVQQVNVITDDLALLEIIQPFRTKYPNIVLNIDYYDGKNGTGENKKNLYAYIQDNKTISYDIVIGNLPADINITKHNYAQQKPTNKNPEKDDPDFFPLYEDFNRKYNGYARLYAVIFPVIVANNQDLPDKKNNLMLTMEEFSSYAQVMTKFDPQKNMIRLGFSPDISQMSDLDFFYIFNAEIMKKNNLYSYNTPQAQAALDFYYNFNRKFNSGDDTVHTYLKRFENIKKDFYLKQNIITFDFMTINQAFALPYPKYKLFFIKDMKYTSPVYKAACILKSSRSKKADEIIIDYLVSNDGQMTLTKKTFTKINFYSYCHLPIRHRILGQIEELPFSADEIEKQIDTLQIFDFFNPVLKKKFFTRFNLAKDNLAKGLITDKEFLNYFSNQMNK